MGAEGDVVRGWAGESGGRYRWGREEVLGDIGMKEEGEEWEKCGN